MFSTKDKNRLDIPLENMRRLEEGLLPERDPGESSTSKSLLSCWASGLIEKCSNFSLPVPDRTDFTSGFFGLMSVAIAAVPKFYGSATIPWDIWVSFTGFNSALGMNLRYTAKLSIKDEALSAECKQLIKDMVLFRAQYLALEKNDSVPHEQLFNKLAEIVMASKGVHQRNLNKIIKDALLLIPYFTSFSLTVFFSRQSNENENENDEDTIYKRNMALLLMNIACTCISIYQIYCARQHKKETKNYRKSVAEEASKVHWEVNVSNQNTSIPKAGPNVLEPDAYKALGLDASDLDDIKVMLRNEYSESVELSIAQAIVDVQDKLAQKSNNDKTTASEPAKSIIRRASSGRDLLTVKK
jgi:hypothetical protein